MQKNLPVKGLRRMLLLRMCMDFIAWAKFLLTGDVKQSMAISKAHYHFLKSYNQNSMKRSKEVKALVQHSGVYRKSIVYAYFINKMRKFSDMNFKS
ncbi:MAG: hypothetical protein EOP48_20460 [Sphingobacteriales bacterium]|nr:MAG: hypothetical protein EOP48_20460 [Sphingobacteriales bacterium]